MNDINIVEYSSKDRDSCFELLKKTFPGTSTDETFIWRFESQSKYQPLILCAKDKDRVVSFISWLPWEFMHNDHKYLGYQGGEAATYKEYRRKGIFGNMLKHADILAKERNIDFLFAFPVIPGSMSYTALCKAGYDPISTCIFCLRLINPLAKNIAVKSDYTFEDFLPQSLYEKNKLTPVFDSDYYNWRYLKNPDNYEVIKYIENNNQAIFIIKKHTYYNKRFKIKLPELLLLDCQFTSFHNIFIANAFKHLDSIYSRKALYIKTFFNKNTDRGEVTSECFNIRLKSGSGVILIIKLINKNLDHTLFYNYKNWDIFPHIIDCI